MFVTPAFAQDAAGGGGGGLEAFLPLILIFVVFYFLLIRPQQKKMKDHKNMLNAVRRGDKVVTGGGIIGTITKVIDDNEVSVEIADGVKVRVQRSLISSVLSKTEPVEDKKVEKERQISQFDFYQALGIKKNASHGKISKSYRNLAKKYHPDQNPIDSEAAEKFKQITDAYETLSNEKEREKYDELGHSEYQNKKK